MFDAHTISPICIAVIVSLVVFLFVGFVSSWYLALIALLGFITIGVIVPMISSGKLKASGVKYRAEFASFNAYFRDSIKGIKDIVLNNAGKEREKEVNDRSDILLRETKAMKRDITKASAATELCVSLFIIGALSVTRCIGVGCKNVTTSGNGHHIAESIVRNGIRCCSSVYAGKSAGCIEICHTALGSV